MEQKNDNDEYDYVYIHAQSIREMKSENGIVSQEQFKDILHCLVLLSNLLLLFICAVDRPYVGLSIRICMTFICPAVKLLSDVDVKLSFF